MFGSSDKWDGLAVFFDSFDNDGQVHFKDEVDSQILPLFYRAYLCASECFTISSKS